jgi:predicted CoA-binding protein
VDSALKIGAKVIWMQEGVFHRQAAERARQAGLVVIMDRCILKEHMSWVYTHHHASPLQPTSEMF